jgi:hypothetical protein
MKNLLKTNKLPLLLSVLLLLAVPALVSLAQPSGDIYRVSRKSQWEQWNFPLGTLDIKADGSITPVKFLRAHNAALNAAQFTHKLKSGREVEGGTWKAGSNMALAHAIIDGDPETFWQPDPDAPLEDWWIEIDLGRTTLVTEIRLTFPDQEGARPLREFRVFGSDGFRVTRDDVFSFHLIGGTTKPINETVVSYNVTPIVRETRRTLTSDEAASSGSVPPKKTSYDLLQYIRILVDAKTPDAALAEVEIFTPGENIALNTLERGGTILERAGRGFAYNMADGDANTSWGARRENNQDPISWEWDLGALFWVDRIVLRTSDFLLRTLTYGSNLPQIRTHQLSASDGSRTLTGAINYDLLFAGDREAFLASSAEFPGQLTYRFSPRPVRYLSAEWVRAAVAGTVGNIQGGFESQSGFIVEAIIFPAGHMAQVEMSSDFIDLGQIAGDQRAKVIKTLAWDADLPPGTRIQARTRSGNTLKENIRYFRKDGTEVTAEQYDQMIRALRGNTETTIGIGDDWSEWSNFYQGSGEAFLSPSPRRFVQVKLLLSSDHPETAPTIRSFSIEFTNALLAGVQGRIEPRFARPGEAQKFTFSFSPQFETRDSGFDRIMVQTPSPVDPESLALKIDGGEVEPSGISIAADSFVVDLPRTIFRNQVELDFSATLKDNATLITGFVGRKSQPGLWQPVDPADRTATTIFLPAVAEEDLLIANLTVRPLITPNGDGIGDVAEIRFHVLKVDKLAQVRIYALDGRLVRELDGQAQSDQSYLYTWTGRNQSESLVAPGIYLCHISIDAQSGQGIQQRIISVAY